MKCLILCLVFLSVVDGLKLMDTKKGYKRRVTEALSYKSKASINPDSFDLYNYHSYDEIMGYVQAVATKYSNLVTISTLGKSFESRDIPLLKIGFPSDSPKNAFFIDAGIHAREWISHATALYAINQFATNTAYTDLLKSIDVYIAPCINPDGYIYSWTTDRNWRKTRSGPRKGCYGVDISRNFPFKWTVSGASNDSCSEDYEGPSSLSEPETKALFDFLNLHNNSIKAYLTLHSYGENILYPYGYAAEAHPSDIKDLISLGNEMRTSIKAVHGTDYIVGEAGDTLSTASGTSDDYAKSVGIKYVYDIELRPGKKDSDNDNKYGFELPKQFIKPTAEEVFPAFILAAKRVQSMPADMSSGAGRLVTLSFNTIFLFIVSFWIVAR